MKGAVAFRKCFGVPKNNINSSGNIATNAYTQIYAATEKAAAGILVSNTAAVPMLLALGGAGVEVDFVVLPVGFFGFIPHEIPAAARISAKALSATANTGFLTLSLMV